jgi:hypothetical protein
VATARYNRRLVGRLGRIGRDYFPDPIAEVREPPIFFRVGSPGEAMGISSQFCEAMARRGTDL